MIRHHSKSPYYNNTMKTKTQYTMMGTLLLGAMMMMSSCTVSQQQADAYNRLVLVGGALLSPEDAAKLATADQLIQAVVVVEQDEKK